MIAYKYRFDQILTIREQEKNEMEISYKESVQIFEEAATTLYELLKKKEETIADQENQMQSGFSILEIHRYASFITGLEKSIDLFQQKVAAARTKMNWHEERLLEKSIEVKKYEKMKEKDQKVFHEEQERLEAIRLDEIASVRFQPKENG
ncbi:flagellar export protein FliJ [Chungangia koreensis]|uniref:Flagellar FliJ protein n=1 Tax=Chungangia koreensis TaxID=752657 RepID=A0ABV8WZX1_9LACT